MYKATTITNTSGYCLEEGDLVEIIGSHEHGGTFVVQSPLTEFSFQIRDLRWYESLYFLIIKEIKEAYPFLFI